MTTVEMIASAGHFIAGQRYDVEPRRARHLAATGYARIITADAAPRPGGAPESGPTAGPVSNDAAKSRRREGRG